MNKAYTFLVCLGLLMAAPSISFAKVNIFACEPEWAALSQEIGGNFVKAKSATHAKQDPHYLRAKPSLLSTMRRADLVFCSGADLEIGWLPVLLQKAGKSSVQFGKEGHLMAADYVPLIGKTNNVDRSQGHVHASGNPHLHLNPHNIELVAIELSKRLSALDPKNLMHYKQNLKTFLNKWKQSTEKWQKQAEILSRQKAVVHHKSWVYLFDWLNIETSAALEAKPGINPTAKHLNKLIEVVKTEKPFLIIRSPYNDAKASNWLSTKTGIQAKEVPFTIYKEKGINTLFDLYESIVSELTSAVKELK